MTNEEKESPVCAMVAERGIKTSRDFTDFMGALMADVVSGRIDPKTANAACVAGGHMLKMAKIQLDFAGSANESIALASGNKALGGTTSER